MQAPNNHPTQPTLWALLSRRLRSSTALVAAVAILMVGAGAAAGLVMEGEVQGSSLVTVSQALVAQKPQSVDFPEGRRFFASTSDDQSKFSVAMEMFRGDQLDVVFPIVNRSSGEAVANFSVTLPDVPTLIEGKPGLVMEASGMGVIDDVVQVSPNSWTFTADASSKGLSSEPSDGLVLTLKVANTAMSGYFELSGRLRTTEF